MASSSSFAGGGSTEEDGVPYSALEDIRHLEERSVLCRHLVRTLLGSLCESVFALLQAKGKLSLRDILQHRPELPVGGES